MAEHSYEQKLVAYELAALLDETPSGWLQRALEESSEAELAAVRAVVRRARLAREVHQLGNPMRRLWERGAER